MATSSVDPREYSNDVQEAIQLALDARQALINTHMPAIVQSVDFAKNTLVAQPAIQGRYLTTDGNVLFVDIAQLLDVPIAFPSGGGFSITFPIAAGDEVLICFGQRCIDSWWQNGGFKNKPMTYRMHDLSDAFAIPGIRSQPRKITNISTTDVQVRNDAGNSIISIKANGDVSIVANGKVTVNSNSEVDLTATDVKVNGKLTVSGDIIAQAKVTATGDVTTDGKVTAKGEVQGGTPPVHLTTHTHPTAGTGPPSPPTPGS